MKPDSATVKPSESKPSGKPRNLTYEGMRAHVEGMKAQAVKQTPAFAVTKIHLPVKDKAGNVVKDADGFVQLQEKVVLQRDLVAAEWDERLAGLE